MLVTGIVQCSLDYLARVEGYPTPDAKCEVLRWEEQGGGPVSTALVALRRLGVEARFTGLWATTRRAGRYGHTHP